MILDNTAEHLEYKFIDDDLDRGYNLWISEDIIKDAEEICYKLAQLFP